MLDVAAPPLPSLVKLCGWLLMAMGLSACESLFAESETPATDIPRFYTDTSILTNDPCAPPCWYGLTPNESAADEVVSALRGIQFLNPESIRERETEYWDPVAHVYLHGELVAADCRHPQGLQCVGITAADGRVKEITVFLNFPIVMGEVIRSLGEPDYLRVFQQGGQFPGCHTQLLYVDEQVVFASKEEDTGGTGSACIRGSWDPFTSPGLRIQKIVYESEQWFVAIPDGDMDLPWADVQE